MENIRKLEIHRLIKELDYIKSDLNYKSEILSETDSEFIKNVNLFLDKHPDLKEVFDEKITSMSSVIVNESIKKKSEILVDDEVNYEVVEVHKDSKLKSLYRSIVKTTHPDKLKDDGLKDLYIEASIAYENNNILPILTICDRLMIPYDVTEEETTLIKTEISSLRDRISFLESTFTWQWYNHSDNNVKDMVILSYIKAQLIK